MTQQPTSGGTARIDHGVTTGTFELDGGVWEVDNNVWVLGDDQECVVLDAPHDATTIMEVVGDRKVTAILLTHAHSDHVDAVFDLQERTGAPIHLHPLGRPLWDLVHPGLDWDEELSDGQTIEVAGVTLHVAKGEFVFLTGPSGAGKSTLLKLIYFDERPSEGEVRVGGASSKSASRGDVARLRRKLGIVFQDFRLLDDRTVFANVAFALEVIGAPAASITPKVGRLLDRVGLGSKANAFPRELSGGEQQRVAIARAVANGPRLLLADEPTGNLDPQTAGTVFGILLSLVRASGLAALIATHNMELASRMDRRVTIRDGLIEQVD